MWKRPPLSIALLTYNRSRYLRCALEGILSQTWGDFELLVMDNASNDDTPETVLSFKDHRLVYVRQPPGKLSGYNWATGLWMARGDFLLITHDDDILESSMLAQQMAAFAACPELSAVATNVSIMDESGTMLQPSLYSWKKDRRFIRGEFLRCFLEEKLWVPMQTCLFRREAMARLVGLKRQWSPAPRLATLATGDILNAIQLNTLGEMLILKDPLLRYRQHRDQEGRGIDQSRHMIELFKILRKAGRTNRFIRPHGALIETRLARYRAQEMMLRTREDRDLSRLKRQVGGLVSRLETSISRQERSSFLVPLQILAWFLDLQKGICDDVVPRLSITFEDRASDAYAAWWSRLSSLGQGLFPTTGGPRRIAVLGSLFAAGLLAMDARRANVDVVCFLESSPVRQGKRLLGRSIHPVSWLSENGNLLDAIVLSSEGEGEEGIRAMIHSHLGSTKSIPMLSWKDIALAASKGSAPIRRDC